MLAKGRRAPEPSAEATTRPLFESAASGLRGRKPIAAADFYAALQRSLDAMQRRLSCANNAFADFVVKEFKVDAAVQLGFNELGVLQFVLADDTMPPGSLSHLSLTLAAVAKHSDEETVPETSGKADDTALADLAWLPLQLVEQLAQSEVKTVSEFLGLVADARISTQIASLLKVRRAEIGRWADRMRLLQLPGMTAAAVDALGEEGIVAVDDLARLDDTRIGDLARKPRRDLPQALWEQWRDTARQVFHQATGRGTKP